jgi:hypothetical protein
MHQVHETARRAKHDYRLAQLAETGVALVVVTIDAPDRPGTGTAALQVGQFGTKPTHWYASKMAERPQTLQLQTTVRKQRQERIVSQLVHARGEFERVVVAGSHLRPVDRIQNLVAVVIQALDWGTRLGLQGHSAVRGGDGPTMAVADPIVATLQFKHATVQRTHAVQRERAGNSTSHTCHWLKRRC